jgi:hypothetical protein
MTPADDLFSGQICAAHAPQKTPLRKRRNVFQANWNPFVCCLRGETSTKGECGNNQNQQSTPSQKFAGQQQGGSGRPGQQQQDPGQQGNPAQQGHEGQPPGQKSDK